MFFSGTKDVSTIKFALIKLKISTFPDEEISKKMRALF